MLQAWVLRGNGRAIYMEVTAEVVDVLLRVMSAPLHNVIGALEEDDACALNNAYSSLASLRPGLFANDSYAREAQSLGSGSDKMLTDMATHGSSHSSNTRVQVKDNAKFMITNDLTVSEASTVAAIALLSKANVDMAKITTEQVVLTSDKLRKLVALTVMNETNIIDALFPAPLVVEPAQQQQQPVDDDIEILKDTA